MPFHLAILLDNCYIISFLYVLTNACLNLAASKKFAINSFVSLNR